MLGRFPCFSKFAIRLLEIAGAGCASALVAFVLDNARHPVPLPPLPPAPVVRLAPADAQLIETVHTESVALAEHLRSERESHNTLSPTPPKPVKTTAPTAPRRAQKTAQVQNPETRQRPSEANAVQDAIPYPAPPTQAAFTDTAEHGKTNGAKQTSGWLAGLDSASDIPRPPVVVGRFTSSAM